MKLFRIACCSFVSFFIFMILASFFSIKYTNEKYTPVSLRFAEKNDDNTYSIPSSTLCWETTRELYIFVVIEEDGPWGKEYICKKIYLTPIKFDSEQDTAYVTANNFLRYPIVESPTEENIREYDKVCFQ